MSSLNRLNPSLRRKSNERSPEKNRKVPDNPPVLRPRIPSGGSEFCDTCSKFLGIIRTEPRQFVPCPVDGAELSELPFLFCPFCSLRWRIMPSVEREKLRGCREAAIKVQTSSMSAIIIISYKYPLQSGSYYMPIACQPCTIGGELCIIGRY